MMLRVFFLSFILTGCSGISSVAALEKDNNYMTFEHPFSDGAAADVLARAEKLCQQRMKVALRTELVCSLTKCVESYQCVDNANAAKEAR